MKPEPRSYLYIPGDRSAFLDKAFTRGADAVIVDLEDAVALPDKVNARDTVTRWLDSPASRPAHGHAAEIWIRVNSGRELGPDLDAFAARTDVTGFCVAKTESADALAEIATRLDDAGSPAGLMPLLESASSVLDAAAIAHAPRVRRLQIGEADLAVDAGIDPSPLAEEFLWARSQVVFASAAVGISAPVAAVSTNFRDLELLTTSTEQLRRAGFFGRACIHPAQLAVANEVFAVDAATAARARVLLDAAAATGQSVFLAPDGTMVDEAVLRAARRTVAQARG